jgi:hypothetical protein
VIPEDPERKGNLAANVKTLISSSGNETTVVPQGFPIGKIWGAGLDALEHGVLFALKTVSTTTLSLDHDGSHVNVNGNTSFGVDSSCFAASLHDPLIKVHTSSALVHLCNNDGTSRLMALQIMYNGATHRAAISSSNPEQPVKFSIKRRSGST